MEKTLAFLAWAGWKVIVKLLFPPLLAQRKVPTVTGRQENSLEYYLLRTLLFKRCESQTFEKHFWDIKLSRGLLTSKRFIEVSKASKVFATHRFLMEIFWQRWGDLASSHFSSPELFFFFYSHYKMPPQNFWSDYNKRNNFGGVFFSVPSPTKYCYKFNNFKVKKMRKNY